MHPCPAQPHTCTSRCRSCCHSSTSALVCASAPCAWVTCSREGSRGHNSHWSSTVIVKVLSMSSIVNVKYCESPESTRSASWECHSVSARWARAALPALKRLWSFLLCKYHHRPYRVSPPNIVPPLHFLAFGMRYAPHSVQCELSPCFSKPPAHLGLPVADHRHYRQMQTLSLSFKAPCAPWSARR